MSTTSIAPTSTWATHTGRVGKVVAAVIVAWIIFALLASLEPNGLHLMMLGVLRVALLASLVAFAAVAGIRSRWGRVGLGLAAAMAVLNLVGGVGAAVTDGLSYNPFVGTSSEGPPWYAYVVGLSALLFAVGTALVGLAGRRAGRLALAAGLAGASYPLVFVLQIPFGETAGAVIGHLLWVAPWLALALGLAERND